MNWEKFQESVDAARSNNVRLAISFYLRDGKLAEDIQPTIKMMVKEVLRVASERGVAWEEVFEELVTREEMNKRDKMGGTDHCDPTLGPNPPWKDLAMELIKKQREEAQGK